MKLPDLYGGKRMKILEVDVTIDTEKKTIAFVKGPRTIKPIQIPETVDINWALKLSGALVTRGYIDANTKDLFGSEILKYITEISREKSKPLEEFLEEEPTATEKPITSKTPEKQKPSLEFPLRIGEDTKTFIAELNKNETTMFAHIAQKTGKTMDELAKFYLEDSQRLKCAPNLLIYRDWRKVGGESIRRVVLMDENMNLLKFFTASENYFPVDTCVELRSNVPLPFSKGRVIGISNRGLLMFFNDYIEFVEGTVITKKILQEPRIDAMDKIPESDEIYSKIPKAAEVLEPIDKTHSLSKIMDLCKQYNAGVEEVAIGVIDAVYLSEDGLRQAIHIGTSDVHPNRVTVWLESQRYTLTENDEHKICRVYGFFQHAQSEYQGQPQDNLNVNAYHFIVEE